MISLIGNKKIRFNIRKSINVPSVITVDQKKLNQILINLLGNSVKFTSEGSIHLFIHAIEHKLYFEVSDTGIGMDPENTNFIFDRFRQIDNSPSKEYKGTGLGLHICKRLIELLDGEIKVESFPGKGTTMKFYIAAGDGSGGEDFPELVKDSGTNFAEHDGDAPLVFIIDKGENVFWYSKIFSAQGFNVIHTDDAALVEKMLSQYLPDLIILKYEMPKIHGQFILNLITENKDLARSHVFVISEVQEVKLSKDQNRIALLHEPLVEANLLKALEKVGDISVSRKDTDLLVLYEKEDRLKEIDPDKEVHYFVPTPDAAKMTLVRRKIKNLVLDGLDVDGVNMKLLKWLMNNRDHLPEMIYIITPGEIFKFQQEEIRKIPYVKHLTPQAFNGKTNLREAIGI